MFLSERERRVLAQIEREISLTDPRFARSMRHGLPGPARWTHTGCNAVVVAAGSSTLLCLALALIGPAVVAGLLAAVTLYLRVHLPPGPSPEVRRRQGCRPDRGSP